MFFKVIKSGFDGICGGESMFKTIDGALREISYHKGWDSLDQLHASIRKWAAQTGTSARGLRDCDP